MKLQEIYASLNEALIADKSIATEYAMDVLKGIAFPLGVNNRNIVAVLSTTVIPTDGLYNVQTIGAGFSPSLAGVPHYVGHPDTKKLVEEMGAVPAESKLFGGLKIGEAAICVPIAQGKSSRAADGFTSPHQNVTISDLTLRIIERLE